jgi:O-antigen ligase
MEADSMRSSGTVQGRLASVDWGAVWTWVLCFGLIAYLGLNGGGFDPLVHGQVGVAVWWIVLVGIAIGAFPRLRPSRPASAALALLAGFVVWTALSSIWTESVEQTLAELARVTTYLGIFLLALISRNRRDAARLIGAVAAAIALIAAIALLSRLHPGWFPDARQTGRFVSTGRERLSYPLDYWNALAALVAIGLPLLAQIAADAGRWAGARAAAAAALPMLMLVLFFTLSRAGIVAAAIAIAVYLGFASDRLPKLLTLVLAGAGGAVLIASAATHEALRQGLENDAARHGGNLLLALAVVVCLLVGACQLVAVALLSRRDRPRWASISRQQSLMILLAGALVLVVAMIAFDAPGRASNAWDEFKRGNEPGQGSGRLGSAAGESRYQFWTAALRENADSPLLGTGSGTFQFWWARDGDVADVVRDAHSLYLQTLGELGIVGFALLVGVLLTILVAGAQAAVRAGPDLRPRLAAALGGCVAFCFAAAFDWLWQIPVVPVAMLLLATLLVSAGPGADRSLRLAVPLRLAAAVVAAAAIVAIAIPLASTSYLRQSMADFRSGDLEGALEQARSARNVEPAAASPRLQEALALEQLGDLEAAAAAARAATERESTSWRPWLVLSRIEAERGRAAVSLAAYRKARSLNRVAPLFQR